MLRMSTKGRYGLRAMIDLAEAYNEGQHPVMMGDIAQRQELSRKYLHALLTSLKQAGLVDAVRGAKGGYYLAKSPEDIKVSDILIALEGDIFIVNCVKDNVRCNRRGHCKAHQVWVELNRTIRHMLDGVSLSRLIGTDGKRVENLNVSGSD
jgi:Rrf2 family transcriptional regulator, cysteine metabolism repressor